MAQPLLYALDPRPDATTPTLLQRASAAGPLLASVALVVVATAACFGFVPGVDAMAGIALLSGAGVGSYVRSQGK